MRKVYIEKDELWPWYRLQDCPSYPDYEAILTEEEYQLVQQAETMFFAMQEMLKSKEYVTNKGGT
jgi:hypothetical protein